METQEEMSRYFWSASTNCLPVHLGETSGNAVSAVRPWDRAAAVLHRTAPPRSSTPAPPRVWRPLLARLGETLAAAGHVPPRFWEVNLIVTVRGVGKERVCSVLKLQLWVMKFSVNLQQEIVKRTLKLIFISWRSTLLSGVELQFKQIGSDFNIQLTDLPKKARLRLVQRVNMFINRFTYKKIYISRPNNVVVIYCCRRQHTILDNWFWRYDSCQLPWPSYNDAAWFKI
jgi:hypothetical protein